MPTRRSPLLPIFLIVLVDVLGLTIVLPLLTRYAEHFHATPLMATLLVSVYAVCQLVSGPFLGRISDRTGRRPMLLVSQIGTFFGFLLMARASSLWMLYAARAIDGSTAGNLSIAQAYIADKTAPKDRAKAFGLIGIAFGAGFTVGPIITGLLVSKDAYLNRPIYVAAALSLLSICCTFFLLPKEKHGARKEAAAGPGGERLSVLQWGAYAQYFSRPVMRGLLGQFFAYMFSFQTFLWGFTLFAERMYRWHGHPFAMREIAFVFAYVSVLGGMLQGGMLGRLVAKFGESKLIVWGFASLVAGYAVLGFSHNSLALLAVAATVSSFGNGVMRAVITSMITQTASASEQGVVLGLTQSLSSVASITAAPLAGAVIGLGLLPEWAWIAAGAALVGLLATRWGSSRVPRFEQAAT